jgi:hypothetical protein
MDRDEFTPQLRATLFSAVTGRAGDVSGTSDDVRGMLEAAFGPGPRGGVNTRAAAKELGVSQRTVQRWLAAEGRQRSRPRIDHLKDLTKRARQAATTKQGRRGALSPARKDSMSRYGAKLVVRGQQGPRRAGRDYIRYRRTDLVLDPADVEALRDAYEAGGDKAFMGWMENHFDQNYVDGWAFSRIESLDFTDPRESGW